MKFLVPALALTLGLSACMYTSNMNGPDLLAVHQDATLGPILVASNGMTLYLYTADKPNVTNCYDQCAVNWPPLIATQVPKNPAGAPGTLSLVNRTDGSKQVAYNGQPLYYWIKDAKPGDTTGQNVNGVWFIVKP